MKTAIMQPYFFPYSGYFKLMSQVDNFIILDDAQYTKRGWINRNYVKDSYGKKIRLTLPLNKMPQKTNINKMTVVPNWHIKHIKTFFNIYKNNESLIDFINFYKNLGNYNNLIDILYKSLIWIKDKYNYKCKFSFSSDYKSTFSNENKIIDLCIKTNTNEYFNLPGGANLYHTENFAENNIKLCFINTDDCEHISIINEILK